MSTVGEFGVSKRGGRTFIYNNYEFWKHKTNKQGQTLWVCSKKHSFKCTARLKTLDDHVIGNLHPEHTHSGNVASALARKAIGNMKERMTETVATPSSSQGAVVANLPAHVQMALPKRASLSRVLRRHRHIQSMVANNGAGLPALPSDLNFTIPDRFREFILHDSGPGDDRLILFGDEDLVSAQSRAELWIADGTFKVVPTLFFQLFSIHFEFPGGINPAGIYCLLHNKSRNTYDRMLNAVKTLIPDAAPRRILLDFESASIAAFREAYPDAEITGCYFHLCQSVLRKVQELGLRPDYDTDDEIRGFVRCLSALSHVPPNNVLTAFQTLVETMPANEKVNDIVTYFENTYIRGRRRPGRGEHYGTAVFPVELWNQFHSAGEGVARTTNSVEGWHHSLQSLFLCQHPNLWTFIAGVRQDCQLSKAAYLQATAGVQHLGKKRYRDLKDRVSRTVAAYGQSDTLTYLRAISHLSHR